MGGKCGSTEPFPSVAQYLFCDVVLLGLQCRAAENLMLSDTVLKSAGTESKEDSLRFYRGEMACKNLLGIT